MAIKRKIAVAKSGKAKKNLCAAGDLSSSKAGVHLDVLYGLRAIDRALHDWKDLEALRLLRLHWSGILAAFEALQASQAEIAVPHRLTSMAAKAKSREARPQTMTSMEPSRIPGHKLLSEAHYPLPVKVSPAQ
jgi:hypothetical protein